MNSSAAEYPKVYLYRRIVQAKLFMDTHYAECIDVDNISNEAYFSKYHFIRLFKKIYGKSPHQYLTFIRIEKSTELLKKGMLVSEVCFSVGFESVSSFSGLFKKMVGISPSEYVAQQMEYKAQVAKTPLKFVPGCFSSQWFLKNSNFEEVAS